MQSRSRKTVHIGVTPVIQQGTETACEIDAIHGSSHVKGGIIHLQNNSSFQLKFEIQQAAGGPTVNFPSNGNAAFSCNSGSCPTASSPSSGGFLGNPQVPDPKTLTVDAD